MKKAQMVIIALALSILMSTPVLASEWKQDTAGWWYQNDDGSFITNQWSDIDGFRYHFDSNGYMQTGVIIIADKQYYFGQDGRLLTNCNTEEGYYLDFNGEITNNSTGLVSLFTWSPALRSNESTTPFAVMSLLNESDESFYISNVCRITTDDVRKTFYMFDKETSSLMDIDEIEPYEVVFFTFISSDLSDMPINEKTTMEIEISFNNNLYQIKAMSLNPVRLHYR